jgi:rSAM/selenodomain-associated transferase 1
MRLSVTLGMMARAPVPGHCKTRLGTHLSETGVAELYAAMIADSIASYSRAGAERNVVLAAPENDGVRLLRALVPARWEVIPQFGAGLGERLANAFRTLTADGSAVVLVDSDSPTLPMDPVANALGRLDGERQVVLGPTDDGGYYLIGLTSLELEVFRDIPWSTPRVLELTLERCVALSLKTELLPSWYDVDHQEDLERLCAELSDCPERAPHCARALRKLGLLKG